MLVNSVAIAINTIHCFALGARFPIRIIYSWRAPQRQRRGKQFATSDLWFEHGAPGSLFQKCRLSLNAGEQPDRIGSNAGSARLGERVGRGRQNQVHLEMSFNRIEAKRGEHADTSRQNRIWRAWHCFPTAKVCSGISVAATGNNPANCWVVIAPASCWASAMSWVRR